MASESSPLTFTQGFMLGQVSFLLIILLFMRYVVFSPADKGDEQGWKRRRQEREKKALAASKAVPTPSPGPAHVLAKAAYDMSTHGAESTDWINVLFAQVMQGYRNDMLAGGGEEGAKLRVEKWLNPDGGRTSWLDPIEVTGMSLGTAYPLFSNARIRPADAQGRIRAEIDVDYNDAISLALSTSVLINFPRPRFAVLPVSLGVELVSIGGTLSVQIHDPEEGRQHLHACLLPDFHLNLKTTTLLGSRAKLQDVPKLEQLILSRIRSAIQDRIVHPKHFSLSLPQLLSSKPAAADNVTGTVPLPNGASSTAKGGPPSGPQAGGSESAGRQLPQTSAQSAAQKMIDDLGEEAVEAMSQAVKEGFGRMVHDLGLDGVVGSGEDRDSMGTGMTGRKTAVTSDGRSTAAHTSAPASVSATGTGVVGTGTSPTRGRRIPMPAGFPYTRTSSTVDPTPIPTPGLAIPGGLAGSGGLGSLGAGAGTGQAAAAGNGTGTSAGGGSGGGVSRLMSAVHTPSIAASHPSSAKTNGTGRGMDSSGQSSAHRIPTMNGAGAGSGDERFRFRGQFAGSASGSAQGAGLVNGDRRIGALNSRA